MRSRARVRGRRGPAWSRRASAVTSASLALGLGLLGCPGEPPRHEGDPATKAAGSEAAVPDPEFRREAHAKALAALRELSLPALRQLDPVAAAEVEGTPLHPPGFGPAARAGLRKALDAAQRQAEGIGPELLSPADGVLLRVLSHAIERGRHRLERPPWRDDPGALVDAVQPYAQALQRRVAAAQCDDGCGLAELGPALEAGLGDVGAAAPATLAAAREDLAALRSELSRACGAAAAAGVGAPVNERAAKHPLLAACPELDATLHRIDARLEPAVAALAAAPEEPWERVVSPSAPAAWKRRPARWSAARLRGALEEEEAYGLPPPQLFELAERTVARLRAMQQRDAASGGAPPDPVLARPFDAAACEAGWAPLRGWIEGQAAGLVSELDCAAAPWSSSPQADDVELVHHMLVHGVVEPTRRARVAATGSDVAMVQGRAAPLAQALVLEIAIASGSGRATAAMRALQQAHHRACLAAAAVWVHGELGDVAQLGERLAAHACGEPSALVAAAEARPRAALRGLGLVLIGDGPAEAAALDRYPWAPIGLVHDLAVPPPPIAETASRVTIEELGEGEAGNPPGLEGIEPADGPR